MNGIIKIFSILILGLAWGCCSPKQHNEPRGMMTAPAVEVPTGEMKNVYFEVDKSELTETEKQVLEKNANILRANATAKIKIIGHADERGSVAYNYTLGKQRANTTAKYLESVGIASERITTASSGKEDPLVIGDNEHAWSRNRTVVFFVDGHPSKP